MRPVPSQNKGCQAEKKAWCYKEIIDNGGRVVSDDAGVESGQGSLKSSVVSLPERGQAEERRD